MRQQARRGAVGTCRRRLNPMTTERSPLRRLETSCCPARLQVDAPSQRRPAPLGSPTAGSNPTRRLPRADGPCQQVRRLRDGPHPAVDLMPTAARPATVVLTGRATTVPFTTDASGCKRTPTDNPTAAMTCAVRSLARWRSCPIWLCKQEVGWSRLASALPCPAGRSVPGRGGPERRRRPRPDGTASTGATLGHMRSDGHGQHR
jgi:hypothetical protein